MPQPASVALVSALKGTGVDDLLIQLHREVGTNGDVWVVRTRLSVAASMT